MNLSALAAAIGNNDATTMALIKELELPTLSEQNPVDMSGSGSDYSSPAANNSNYNDGSAPTDYNTYNDPTGQDNGGVVIYPNSEGSSSSDTGGDTGTDPNADTSGDYVPQYDDGGIVNDPNSEDYGYARGMGTAVRATPAGAGLFPHGIDTSNMRPSDNVIPASPQSWTDAFKNQAIGTLASVGINVAGAPGIPARPTQMAQDMGFNSIPGQDDVSRGGDGAGGSGGGSADGVDTDDQQQFAAGGMPMGKFGMSRFGRMGFGSSMAGGSRMRNHATQIAAGGTDYGQQPIEDPFNNSLPTAGRELEAPRPANHDTENSLKRAKKINDDWEKNQKKLRDQEDAANRGTSNPDDGSNAGGIRDTAGEGDDSGGDTVGEPDYARGGPVPKFDDGGEADDQDEVGGEAAPMSTDEAAPGLTPEDLKDVNWRDWNATASTSDADEAAPGREEAPKEPKKRHWRDIAMEAINAGIEGLRNEFGVNAPVPTPDQEGNVRQYLSGAGADVRGTQELMNAVDPKGEMSLSDRLNAAISTAAHATDNMLSPDSMESEAGAKMVPSILQAARIFSDANSALASHAADANRPDKAAQHAERAFGWTPGANPVQVLPTDQGFIFRVLDENGKPVDQRALTTNQFQHLMATPHDKYLEHGEVRSINNAANTPDNQTRHLNSTPMPRPRPAAAPQMPERATYQNQGTHGLSTQYVKDGKLYNGPVPGTDYSSGNGNPNNPYSNAAISQTQGAQTIKGGKSNYDTYRTARSTAELNAAFPKLNPAATRADSQRISEAEKEFQIVLANENRRRAEGLPDKNGKIRPMPSLTNEEAGKIWQGIMERRGLVKQEPQRTPGPQIIRQGAQPKQPATSAQAPATTAAPAQASPAPTEYKQGQPYPKPVKGETYFYDVKSRKFYNGKDYQLVTGQRPPRQ